MAWLTGDSLPIKLTVYKDRVAATPSVATITITGPAGVILENATAMTISGNEVSFTLSNTKTTTVGNYYFIVALTLDGIIKQFKKVYAVE